jgi:hypothetical protein
MLIGHYAPALLLKTRTPKLPLWALFIAVEVLDYLWSAFVLTGLERMRFIPGFNASNGLDLYDMPYSHSLVATFGWSLLAFGVTVFWLRRQPGRWGYGLAIAVGVASHFLLDLVVHVRDLPLAGTGSFKLGFGLWNDRPLALLVETGLFVGSVLALTFSGDWRKRRGFWLLGGSMSVLCVASYFIPTPTSSVEMALSGLSLYVIFPLLAWRVERPVTSGAASAPSPG